jgi:hypothetical protein
MCLRDKDEILYFEIAIIPLDILENIPIRYLPRRSGHTVSASDAAIAFTANWDM